ncbi:MAG: ABC transporter permease, partial [Roseovarius sp.]|uniref:ABC transporter permease subunit n=1 Tax=Roseovarius sp. TaxID=1486281 RepID=UPI0032EBD9A4
MIINFFITVRLTLPVVLVALVVAALIGSSLWLLILVIGLLLWDRFAIVVRSATQQLAQREYITSARAIGSS